MKNHMERICNSTGTNAESSLLVLSIGIKTCAKKVFNNEDEFRIILNKHPNASVFGCQREDRTNFFRPGYEYRNT
ncbi:hypothetical protein DOE52_02595 [Porphyromonas gingivalis]|nr:hypothetical protein DOE52_02595 [Porphyromonas gingivalis]